MPELIGEEYWIYDFLKKEVVIPGNGKEVTGSLEAGAYKWFVFLLKGTNSSCLGLLDKYAGFTAVEAVFTEGNTDIIVLTGTGTVAWISEKTPVRVTADARDVTEQMTSKGILHTLPLPEDVKKTVITLNWSE